MRKWLSFLNSEQISKKNEQKAKVSEKNVISCSFVIRKSFTNILSDKNFLVYKVKLENQQFSLQ